MKQNFILRKLPLAIASLFVASSGFSLIAMAQDNPPAAATTTRSNEAANAVTNITNATTNAATNAAAAVSAPPTNTVIISSQHLKSARTELLPNLGTTVYTVDASMIKSLGQGDDTPFDQVLLRLPGVAEDSKASGSLHIRDDHGNVQYRVNGVQLPDGISGFGQSIDTRLVDQIQFVTGALPAQYGLRTAGIIDIQTREGSTEPGGRVGVLMGSHNYVEPSAEVFGSKGAFNYYLSGSYLQNSNGIENPTSSKNPLHDNTVQSKSFGNFSYYLDDDTRLGLLFGTYAGNFQIPNNPNQTPQYTLSGVTSLPSSLLNERQREENSFAVFSYQKSLGALNYQASFFHQYSLLHYTPDVAGDLMYNGVASNSLRNSSSNGVQVDASYKLNPYHTLRGGIEYARQNTESANTTQVFSVDGSGAQTSSTPVTLIDNQRKTGTTSSFYLQDEWSITKALTLNYGLRFDRVDAFIQEWSPRLNLAYKVSPATALHAGYSRYFTPPSQELLSQASVASYQGTSAAAEITTSGNVRAERTNYYDMGLVHKVSRQLSVTADIYYKQISNLLDEGQFGQALILSPFNYAKGYAKGLELSAIYDEKLWGGFLNFSMQQAKATNIISGQSLFGATELAYIANNYVYLDHNQTYTLSGGAHVNVSDYKLSSDFLYGSGLRNTPLGGAPNSSTVPAYTVVNATISHTWNTTGAGKIEGRIALLNLFDRSYLLRDGSGIGVGAPQYGARRTLFVGLSSSF